MKAATHSLGGAGLWLGGCALVHPSPAVTALGGIVAAVVAPWPDIDNLGAWSRRRPGWFINWRARPVKSRVAALVTRKNVHRQTWTHSLAGAGMAGFAAWLPWFAAGWWPWWISLAVAAGWASHPLLDTLNRRPVRLWWPSPRLVLLLPTWARVKVGGPGEAAAACVLAGVVALSAWAAVGT